MRPGEVARGLGVVECAVGVLHPLKDESVENVDTHHLRRAPTRTRERNTRVVRNMSLK